MNKFKIIKDETFGYYRVDPIPTAEEVERYYLEEFYSDNYQAFNNSTLEVQKTDQEFFDSRWEKMYENFNRFFGEVSEKSLFDIGFGFAQALIYFHKKGLEVSGIEPSPEGVNYARSQGLNVYKGGIEAFGQVDRKFDIVTLVNVLEHLRDPVGVLASIKEQLLERNGLLVVDVPNDFNDFQVVANEEYDLHQWWVCPPNHVNYFTNTSLCRILKAVGYKVTKSEATFPLEMFLLFGDVYVGNGDIGKLCHNKRVNFEKLMRKHGKTVKLNRFYESLAHLNLGRNTIVYCTYE